MKIFFYFPLFLIAIVYLQQALKRNSLSSRYFYRFKEAKTLGIEKPAEYAINKFNETDKMGFIILSVIIITDVIFSLIGIFSFNGGFFVLYFLFNVILGKHIFKYNSALLLKGIFILFVILNSYQLQFNLIEYFKSLL